MATHSSILAWKIPWTEEPGRLQSMELLRVGHDRATEHASFAGLVFRQRMWNMSALSPRLEMGSLLFLLGLQDGTHSHVDWDHLCLCLAAAA